jgi:hypothetical protein
MDTNNKCPEKIIYGWDNLSKFLTFVGCIFCLLTAYKAFLGLVMISYAFWRSRSKNTMRRIREERAFLKFLDDVFCAIYSVKNGRIFFERKSKFKTQKKYRR